MVVMHLLVFYKYVFGELPDEVKNKLLLQTCCRESCFSDLEEHHRKRIKNLNFVICDNGEIRFWCLGNKKTSS